MAETGRSQKVDEVLGRAIRDKSFRRLLVENPTAAAKQVGLTSEELRLVAGGMAIGNSLLGGGVKVAFCTAKTCNETGGDRLGLPFGVDPGLLETQIEEGSG
jgi:hypothetical protein